MKLKTKTNVTSDIFIVIRPDVFDATIVFGFDIAQTFWSYITQMTCNFSLPIGTIMLKSLTVAQMFLNVGIVNT